MRPSVDFRTAVILAFSIRISDACSLIDRHCSTHRVGAAKSGLTVSNRYEEPLRIVGDCNVVVFQRISWPRLYIGNRSLNIGNRVGDPANDAPKFLLLATGIAAGLTAETEMVVFVSASASGSTAATALDGGGVLLTLESCRGGTYSSCALCPRSGHESGRSAPGQSCYEQAQQKFAIEGQLILWSLP